MKSENRPPRSKTRPRVPVTDAALAKVALSYLERVPASSAALEKKLRAWVKERGDPADVSLASPLIRELVERYQRSGLLNDEKLAELTLDSMRARGRSRLDIERRLALRGVPAPLIQRAVNRERETTDGAELAAAKRLVKKRRLGPFRPEAERASNRRKDLGVLARAGFDFDIAVSALGAEGDDYF